MEDGLGAELDEELGYSKYDYRNKEADNSRSDRSKRLRTSQSICAVVFLDAIRYHARSEGSL